MVATGGPAAGPPKGRGLSVMQLMAGGLMCTMLVVVVYMYRVIDSMQRDQEALRIHIAELTSGGKAFHDLESHQNFPPARPAFLNASPSSLTHEQRRAGFIDHHDEGAERRKLGSMMTVGTGTTDGCFQVDGTTDTTYDLSSATACNSHVCPDCFITPTGTNYAAARTYTISSCSSAKWVSRNSQARSGAWTLTFINQDASHTMIVTDGTTTYNIPVLSYVTAYCSTTQETANRLMFSSARIPTLTVDSGFTLNAGAFDASGSSGAFTTSSGTNTLTGNTVVDGSSTFSTGSGAVTLAGDTTVSGTKTFAVGSSGSGGLATFYGGLTVGANANGAAAATTLYGNFAQNDDPDGTLSTFSTGTNTISLNGDVSVADGKDLMMTTTGSGTFATGTGTVALNGDTTIEGSHTLTTGSGTVTLAGNTVVSGTKTFTVGSAGSGGLATMYGGLTVGGSASGASAATTLYGNFAQNDDGDGSTLSTFSTGTNSISLNGDISVADGKDLMMTTTGTGTFSTGAGAVTLYGNVQINGAKTFATGTGTVALNGNTAVGDSATFTVGSPGSAANTELYGDVYIGGSTDSTSTSLTVRGPVTFSDDNSGSPASTFTTGTGQITLNGDVSVAADKDILMADTGAGTFTSATGQVSFKGPVDVINGKEFKLQTSRDAAIVCDTTISGSNYVCRASR